MKILGNIIWLIFGGLHTAIEYFIAGLVLMITIIGHSLGEDAFPLGKAGPITVRNGGCITVLSLSSGLPMFKRV